MEVVSIRKMVTEEVEATLAALVSGYCDHTVHCRLHLSPPHITHGFGFQTLGLFLFSGVCCTVVVAVVHCELASEIAHWSVQSHS